MTQFPQLPSQRATLTSFARNTAAFATLAFGLSLIAAPAAKAAPLKIGMTFQELNNPYFVTMQKALNDAAASIGATVVVTDAHHDVSKQVSDVEDMLQKKIDILLVRFVRRFEELRRGRNGLRLPREIDWRQR